jgi:hypothetical protein
MQPSEMTKDLFPRNAKDNKKIGASSGSMKNVTDILQFLLALSIFTTLVFIIGIFSPFGLAFILFSYIYCKARSRTWRVLARIVQISATAIIGLAGLLLICVSLFSSSSLLNVPMEIAYGSSSHDGANFLWILSILLPILAFLALPIIVMVHQARRCRMTVNTASMPPIPRVPIS